MRIVIGASCLAVLGGAAYFVLMPSAEEQLATQLRDVLGDEVQVALSGCDLSLITEAEGPADGPVALTRVSIRADLARYKFETVQIVPQRDGFVYRASRARATNAMMDQVDAVFSVGPAELAAVLPDSDGIREILNDDNGAVFARVMAEIKDVDGEMTFIAHEDAPSFYRFAQDVEGLAPPVSYQVTTTYSGPASGDTLLTGEVIAMPVLAIPVATQAGAQDMGRAIYTYAKNACS